MTHEEVVDHISTETGLTKKQVRTALDSFTGLVTTGVMESNQRVPLNGIGIFKKVTKNARPERNGRNPKTGEPIVIPATPAKDVLRFLPAANLR